jgi:hypothetical protein
MSELEFSFSDGPCEAIKPAQTVPAPLTAPEAPKPRTEAPAHEAGQPGLAPGSSWHVLERYAVLMNHDAGRVRLIVTASSEDQARRIVCDSENAPERSIVSVERLGR